MNELVTNAAKHGKGKITVSYQVEPGIQIVSVCDEGADLPAGFDPTSDGAGLGMRVITVLAAQLGGALDVSNHHGRTCFSVSFPR